jgi:hypothetical protein
MRFSLLGVVVISACTVGSAVSPGGGGGPDASQTGVDAHAGSIDAPMGSGSGSGSGSGNGCINQVTTGLGDGHHNPGQDCMNACHNHGFTLAGTVYTSINSNTAVTGATISVTDANGQQLKIVTQLNGNFYTSQPVAFPVTVNASECPNIQKMTAQVVQGQGGCNRVGCHVSGAQGHIHLP